LIKSGVSLIVAGVSLVVIGTVVSPSLHQPLLAFENGQSGWRIVDRVIAVSGGILFLLGLTMTVLGLRGPRGQQTLAADGHPDSSRSRGAPSSPERTAPGAGDEMLTVTIGIIVFTAFALSAVILFVFSQA
jgi:hypothetical protein